MLYTRLSVFLAGCSVKDHVFSISAICQTDSWIFHAPLCILVHGAILQPYTNQMFTATSTIVYPFKTLNIYLDSYSCLWQE